MKGYAMEKQDRVLNGFTKIARQTEGPDFITRDMARSKEIATKIANKSGKTAIAVPAEINNRPVRPATCPISSVGGSRGL